MRLNIITPTGVLLETDIQKISLEALDGFCTLLSNHAPYATALKTGIVSFTDTQNKRHFAACDGGILIKQKTQVDLATRLCIIGDDLKALQNLIAADFKKMEEERKTTSKSMAQLELSLTQGFLELSKRG